MTATVMVVDDDEALRESVCELLEEFGYTAVAAANGVAALEQLRREPEKPDVILLDLMMPGMNGWQFRDAQLSDPELSDIPVVVMTATREVRGIQADDVVYKPVNLDRLIDAVSRHVNGGRVSHVAVSPPSDPAKLAAQAPPSARALFAGGGELGRRMAEIDWSSTSLGPVDGWPQSLKTCVRIILTSRQPMFVWWGDDLVNLYNDAYKSIIGDKHPEALARPASQVWAEIWDQVGPRAAQAMRSQEGTYDEALLLIMHRYGYDEETYYTFSYSPVPNDDGGTGGLICANTADTERIVGERQLSSLHALAACTSDQRSWRNAFGAAADALSGNPKDIPFALIYALDPGQRVFELAGRTGFAEGHPAAPQRIAMDDTAVWPLGETLGGGLRLIDDLGARFFDLPCGAWSRPPSQAALVPIVALGNAGTRGVLVVGLNPYRLFDQSYHRFLELVSSQLTASIATAEAYEAERRRVEALTHLDQVKTTFFSNVSHEFRTPLTLMLGPLADLLAGDALDATPRHEIERVHRNALRLQKLVNNLLDFSRLEADRTQAAYAPVDLAALTSELAGAFRSAIERAGLTLEIDCPPIAAPTFVDRDMWEKIVLNLLSNALKFTFEGGISVSLRETPMTVELRVADTGVGIAGEELPHLFERFHRIEGVHARTHEGTGIGLALVQELAKLHGGATHVESRHGHGTTFVVSIPKGSAHLPAERIGAASGVAAPALSAEPFVEEALRWLPEASPPVAGPAAADATIVIADDNPDMRDYLQRLLAPLWRVEAVADGQAALTAARERLPDLILSDVRMPGLDGFALIRALRQDESTRLIPVVLLSARAGEEATVEGLSAGADDYLVKPFPTRELIARVRTQLELGKLRRQLRASNAHLFSLFMQAPIPICVLRGPELVIEMANARYIEVTGNRDIIGKPLLEAMPEGRGQGFDELLLEVMRSGVPREGHEHRAAIRRGPGGAVVETLWDFIFTPLDVANGVPRVMVIATEVTEQVAARQVVEQSEERLKRLIAHAEAGIAQLDPSGCFTLVNERFRDIVGRSEKELLNACEADLLHPDEREAHLEKWRQLIEHRIPFAGEKRYVRPDGSVVWVQSNVSCIDDPGGQLRVAAVTLDITQRKLVELALRESEERFRNMADHAPVMVWVSEPDGRSSYRSASWHAFTGQSQVQGLGLGWLDAVHPSDRRYVHDSLAASNARHEPFRIEYRLRRHDGVFRWALDSATPRFASDGSFLGYIGSVMDITERRTGENALAASEARYRSIFESAEVSLWEQDFSEVKRRLDAWHDEHGDDLRACFEQHPERVDECIGLVHVRDVNPATLRLLGAETKEQLQGSLRDVFLPETKQTFCEELIAIAEGQPSFSSEAVMQTLQGERIDVLATMSLAAAGDNYERVLVSLTDISARKRAEHERETRLAEVEQALQFSETFVGILGHDLRNPLGSISAAAQLLMMRAKDDKLQAPLLRIRKSTERMARMIEQILDFTRVRLGSGIPISPAPVDLEKLATHIIEELEASAPQRITLDTRGDTHGEWDSDRLAQVLSNLLGNAIEHGDPSQPIRLTIDGTSPDGVQIEVWNGGAIPEDIQASLFDPFRHARTKSEKTRGLGLGLFIVERVIESHGGSVALSSSPEQGTRFMLRLPKKTVRRLPSRTG